MAAPIVIAVILVAYCIGYGVFCLCRPELSVIVKLSMGLIALALAGVCIAMLVERIKEMRSGEEDDLGKY